MAAIFDGLYGYSDLGSSSAMLLTIADANLRISTLQMRIESESIVIRQVPRRQNDEENLYKEHDPPPRKSQRLRRL
jgi:hypothetical protein